MHLTKQIAIILMFFSALALRAQKSGDPYKEYIDRYASLAQEQEQLHGIPASITLAQGLLESRAGQSTLATEANNHFGIKCHTNWQGPSVTRSDDAPDECFRAYASARESFEDHSRFLATRRYQPLYELSPGDYAAWAHTLKSCGYATDPNYAYRLIAIIERYSLHDYDRDASGSEGELTDFIVGQLKTTHPPRRYRALHYVIAFPTDTYASIAKEFGVDARQLAAYNDATDVQAPIKPWEEVYLQPKLDTAPKGVKSVTIGVDESVHSLSQRYGVTMAHIKQLNPNLVDKPGTKLKL